MKKTLYFIPAFLWMIFIFSMSMQTGQESSKVSLQIVAFINQFLHFSNSSILHTIIRKGAHMCEYAILALLLYYGFKHFLQDKIYLFAFLSSILYAGLDECHQLFVDGRAGRLTDILIDTSGACLALLILYFLTLHIKQKRIERKYYY